MPPDAVERAIDALLAKVPAPAADADAIVARGRRRIARRRLVAVGAAVTLISALAAVGALARANHATPAATPARASTPTSTPTPTAATAATAAPSNRAAAAATDSTRGLVDVAVVSAREAWKCTDPLRYTNDGGNTWRTVATPAADPAGTGNPNSMCAAVTGGDAWAVQTPDPASAAWTVLRVRGGASARVLSFPFGRAGTRVLTVTFLDADHGWVVTIGDESSSLEWPIRSLYRTVDGGRTWQHVADDVPIAFNLQFTSPTQGWTLGTASDLFTTNDGGATWHRVLLPSAPATASIASVVAKGSAIVVWCDAIDGASTRAFFDVSSDGGRTWSRRPGPPGLDLAQASPIVFDAVDASHWRLYAGSLWSTDDGGRTWTEGPQVPIAEIHSMSFPTPEVGWMSANVGDLLVPALLRTTDGGRTWTDVSKALPPIPLPFAG